MDAAIAILRLCHTKPKMKQSKRGTGELTMAEFWTDFGTIVLICCLVFPAVFYYLTED